MEYHQKQAAYQALIRLFQELGYDSNRTDGNSRELFFTNFVLGYRKKGISGNFRREWADHDKGYFARLVNILEPERILCLGRDTFSGVLTAFPELTPPKIKSYNRFLESGENPVNLTLPSGKTVRMFALAHCGKLGALNRNRGAQDKTSLEKQLEDWRKIPK